MLRSLNKILGSLIVATDGEIGTVYNVWFEDVSWRVVYLVVKTGGWFNRHMVLLSPMVLGKPDWNRKVLAVSLAREQVKSSPDVDTDQPVSRQAELALNQYYGWPSYWDVPAEPKENLMKGDPHLRSCRELMDYHVTAKGEELGWCRISSSMIEAGPSATRGAHDYSSGHRQLDRIHGSLRRRLRPAPLDEGSPVHPYPRRSGQVGQPDSPGIGHFRSGARIHAGRSPFPAGGSRRDFPEDKVGEVHTIADGGAGSSGRPAFLSGMRTRTNASIKITTKPAA